MPPENEVKDLLNKIVALLNRGDDDARKLWNVVTALRGPDSENPIIKLETTARLRGALGLEPYGWLSALTVSSLKPEHNYPTTDHFSEHYNAAVSALNELGII